MNLVRLALVSFALLVLALEHKCIVAARPQPVATRPGVTLLELHGALESIHEKLNAIEQNAGDILRDKHDIQKKISDTGRLRAQVALDAERAQTVLERERAAKANGSTPSGNG